MHDDFGMESSWPDYPASPVFGLVWLHEIAGFDAYQGRIVQADGIPMRSFVGLECFLGAVFRADSYVWIFFHILPTEECGVVYGRSDEPR